MSITLSSFGTLRDGRASTLYTLTNKNGASVCLSDHGARLVSVFVPDREGRLADVCLGFDSVSGYEGEHASVGGTIGRVANRIGGAAFTLNGRNYTLPVNSGKHATYCLHGGPHGFHTKLWQAAHEEKAGADRVVFRCVSADGEAGFPGKMEVTVTYTWTDSSDLHIDYSAVSDQDTLCNLTNHAYFILDDSENALDHTLQINASRITTVNDSLIPTGEDAPVDGLPVDLRKPLSLRAGIARASEYPLMQTVNGYDFNYRVDGEGFREHAVLASPASGRALHVLSSEPCIQLYTGQHFDLTGHGGRHYGTWAGIALDQFTRLALLGLFYRKKRVIGGTIEGFAGGTNEACQG